MSGPTAAGRAERGNGKGRPYLRLLLLLALASVPFWISNIYYLNVMTMAGLYVILSLGLNVLFGYAGQVSLGHAGFYAVGAYTVALLTTKSSLPFWVCLPLAGLVSLLVGLAWSVPTLKLEGAYLAVATIGFGEIVRLVLVNWEGLTGGPMGVKDIPRPTILGFTMRPGPSYYWLVLLFAAGCYVCARNLLNSHVGRLFVAVRDDPVACLSCGANVARLKIVAFGISTIYAGVAGGLYAGLTGYVAPTAFTSDESISILAMVVVGGAASNEGAVLGALLIAAAREMLHGMQTLSGLFYGLIILLAILFVPNGLVGLSGDIVRRVPLHRMLRWRGRGIPGAQGGGPNGNHS